MTALPLTDIALEINRIAKDHGFYEDAEGEPIERNFGEVIALMHSELSEALEEHRDGHPVVWFENGTGKPEGAAIELVDCAIRIFDTLHEMLQGVPYTIDDLFTLKMSFNDSRPYKHGRAY